MNSRRTDYDISSVTSFGTPTQRRYYYHDNQQQQQQPDDGLRQISSLNAHNDARLNSPQRQQPLWQKLLVSHRAKAAAVVVALSTR